MVDVEVKCLELFLDSQSYKGDTLIRLITRHIVKAPG